MKTNTLAMLCAGALLAVITLVPGRTAAQWVVNGGAGRGYSVQNLADPTAPTTLPAARPMTSAVDAQKAALALKLDVSYHRAYPVEVINDLRRRGGLTASWSQAIDRACTITLDGQMTVKESLDKAAAAGNLQLDYRDAEVVITLPAEAGALDQLAPKLKNADRWVRCAAVSDLAAIGDKAVPAMLVKMLQDADDGVAMWAQRGLGKHMRLVHLQSDADKAIVVDQMKARIDELDGKPAKGGWGWMPDDRLSLWGKLLAATQLPDGQKALVAWAQDAKRNEVRCMAVSRLIPSGAPDAVATLIGLYKEAKDILDKDKAARGDKPLVINGEGPVFAAMNLQNATLAALRSSDSPQAIAFLAQETKPGALMRGRFVMGMGSVDDDGGIGIAVSADSLNAALEILRNAADKGLPPAAANPGGRAVWALGAGAPKATAPAQAAQMPAVPSAPGLWQISNALSVVYDADNAAAVDLVVKTINDTELLKGLAPSAGMGQQETVFLVNDPAILKAILDQLAAAGDNTALKNLLARSLGTSHDAAAADALLKLLSDADATVRGEAAKALAATHDPRGADALVSLLKTSSAKLEWPDLEKAEYDKLMKGGAARSVTNPRNIVAAAVAATRDPKAMDLLLAVAEDASMEADAREAALLTLPSAAMTADQIKELAVHLEKLDITLQRTVLLVSDRLFGGLATIDGPCWHDGTIVGLLADRTHDEQAFRVYKDVRRGNRGVERLVSLNNPRAEHALAIMCQDPDQHLAYYAAQGVRNYRDPQIDVKIER